MSALTPRQMPQPSDFMLPPTDWRSKKTVGGVSGKIASYVSKSPRFPEPSKHTRPQECVSPSNNGTVAYTVKKLPNAAGATFRSKTPQRPEPKRPLGDVVTKVDGAFPARGKSPASSCFRSTCARFPFDDPRRQNASVRQSVRQDQDVLSYQKVPDWRKQPFRAATPSATYRDKSVRFPAPRALSEYTGNVPQVSARGVSMNMAKANVKASAWTKRAGHEDFLPDPPKKHAAAK